MQFLRLLKYIYNNAIVKSCHVPATLFWWWQDRDLHNARQAWFWTLPRNCLISECIHICSLEPSTTILGLRKKSKSKPETGENYLLVEEKVSVADFVQNLQGAYFLQSDIVRMNRLRTKYKNLYEVDFNSRMTCCNWLWVRDA